MKKIALMSTFCDTDQKIEILQKNIHILKNIGIDVLVLSPIELPLELINSCDHFFRTKNNPVLDWPVKSIFMWKEYNVNDKVIRMSKTFSDYGWAGIYQVKILSEIGLAMGYDKFYHMIYDLKIDDNVIEGINSDRTFSVYPSKRDDTIWGVGLHYMIFDKEKMKEFISHISLESYLSNSDWDAFVWLHELNKVFPYKIESTPVEDEIFYYDGIDLFNFSDSEKVKFFIESDDENPKNIKIFFYHIDPQINVELYIEDEQYNESIVPFSIIDLGFNKFNIKNVHIKFDEIIYDFTQKIRDIKHSTIECYD